MGFKSKALHPKPEVSPVKDVESELRSYGRVKRRRVILGGVARALAVLGTLYIEETVRAQGFRVLGFRVLSC